MHLPIVMFSDVGVRRLETGGMQIAGSLARGRGEVRSVYICSSRGGRKTHAKEMGIPFKGFARIGVAELGVLLEAKNGGRV